MDFHGIDLNLLVAFDALASERNVTRAATRVGVSQPAMSAALSRLRTLLGDPLFLRSANGLLPTQRARDLAGPVAAALRQIESAMMSKPAFDPANAVLTFNLGLPDYPSFVLLPTLLSALEVQAPGVTLNVHAVNGRDAAIELLDSGVIDAAISVPAAEEDGRIKARPLLRDEFVTVLASDHPAARAGLDLPAYLELQHVLVSPEGHLYGLVDRALAEQGLKRRLALTLPHMFAVPPIIAQTRMTSTILKRAALHAQASHQLAILPPPLALPEIVFDLMWHRRSDTHAAQSWLRDLLAAQAATVDASSGTRAIRR
ncbi:LysR family transcriptional regulator [Duganella sp. P38]|uniref:LysR family transcriptional regulator n=1 Tax=Duganella sp. P38 TaxID=3423949 RepID=UPI003D7A1F55